MLKAKTLVRKFGITILYQSQIASSFLRKTEKYIRILNYHKIERASPMAVCDFLTVDPKTFEIQIDMLINKGFHFISVDDLWNLLSSRRRKIPPKTILLTFDDGSLSIYTNAFPILQERRIPFVIFLTTGPCIHSQERRFWWEQVDECLSSINGPLLLDLPGGLKIYYKNLSNINEKRHCYRKLVNFLQVLPFEARNTVIKKLYLQTHQNFESSKRSVLQPKEIKKMLSSGLVSLGTHTVTHRALGYGITKKELEFEIMQPVNDIKNVFDYRPFAISLPFGIFKKSTLQLIKDAGYKMLFTTFARPNHPQRIINGIVIMDRVSIGTNDDKAAFWVKVSGLYGLLRHKRRRFET